MPIYYPLIPPATPGFRRAQWVARAVSSLAASPFTGQQQVYSWPGEWWEGALELPPMTRAQAEDWISFLTSLRGCYGTFLMSPPNGKTARGAVSGGTTTPQVYGAGQIGTTLTIWNLPPFTNAVFLPGDYIQITKNYIPDPNAFQTANWTKVECSVAANTITGPHFLAVDADRVTPDVGATNAYLYQTTAPAGNFKSRAWTAAVWIKAATGTPSINIGIVDDVDVTQTVCNLTTSWQQFTVTRTVDATATFVRMRIGGASSWIEADGAVDLWGARLYCQTLDARLHKVLKQIDVPGGDTHVTLDIFPTLRESPTDCSPIIVASPTGTFRLAENLTQWDINEAKHYGLDFKIVEAF